MEKNWKFDGPSYVIGVVVMATMAVIVFIAFLFTQAYVNNNDDVAPTKGIPSCSEDEIIVGTGDYSGGFWTNYKCGHGDW